MNMHFKECGVLISLSFIHFGRDDENMTASLMLGQSICSKKNTSTPPALHSIDILSIIQKFCLSVRQSRCQPCPTKVAQIHFKFTCPYSLRMLHEPQTYRSHL